VTSVLNRAFLKLQKRADQTAVATLVETFVDVGPLFTMLAVPDHQILFGRRGTGKTHALTYLADDVTNRGQVAVFIDMRTIGSTGGVYGDPNLPTTERGTRLLLDTLAAIQDALSVRVLEGEYGGGDFVQAMALLDDLSREVTDSVRVVGAVEMAKTDSAQSGKDSNAGIGVEVSLNPKLSLQAGDANSQTSASEAVVKRTGIEQHYVHFGAVAKILGKLVPALGTKRLWILIDEWASVPLDLQPLLADLLRRSLFPVQGVTVKIGAIEQRSKFLTRLENGDRQGIELGADATSDNLDDFMVFRNESDAAKEFFQNLLFKHVVAVLTEDGMKDEALTSARQLVEDGFTQRTAFDEFVKAAEGVPRDAIHVLGLAAQRANDKVISVPILRSASRDWYQRDKEKNLSSEARELLVWIIEDVLGDKQARAFMLRQGDDQKHPLVRTLYDERVLHIVRKGIAARDQPGVRFDGWALDYGCYVELVSTVKAPRGLFEVETETGESFVEVPQDDYRSIRRAILDLQTFEGRQLQLDMLPPVVS
jgi:hypothetical protein